MSDRTKQRVQRASDWHHARWCQLPPAAADDTRMTLAHFRVLAYLGRVGKGDGWCEFSQKALAERVGISRQTLNEATADLVKWKYLKKRSQAETKLAVCHYKVALDKDGDVSAGDDTPQDDPCQPDPTDVSAGDDTRVAYKDTALEPRTKNQVPPNPHTGDMLVLEAFHLWNETALRFGLPQSAKLTPDRKRKIKARLVDYGIDGWRKVIENISRSRFLRGLEGDRKWKCNLDFVCSPSGFSKIFDGAYDAPSKFGGGRPVGASAAPLSGPKTVDREVQVFHRGTPEYAAALERARREDPARAEGIEIKGWVKTYPLESRP